MITFFAFICLLGISFAVVFAAVEWLTKALPKSKPTIAFILACAAAFALSISADIFFATVWVNLPAATATASIGTWLAVAAFCQCLAQNVITRKWLLVTPYIGTALYAAFGGIVSEAKGHTCLDFSVSALLFLAAYLVAATTRGVVPLQAIPAKVEPQSNQGMLVGRNGRLCSVEVDEVEDDTR